MLLAIDTATQVMSLALHDGDSLRAEVTWHTANNHTAELAPTVRDLLARSDTSLDDLTALAVSIGPGSYTGLRIGVALAKGLAAARGLPLVGVSSLDTLAAAQPYVQGSGLVVVVEAGRGRVIAATYRWRRGRWDNRGEPEALDWDTLIASIDGPAALSGDINAEARALLEEAQARGVPITINAPVYRLRRAGFLAEEALARLRAGGDHDAARLGPLYVKTRDLPGNA